MRASVLVGVFWRGEELAAGRVVVRETKIPPGVSPGFEIQVHDMAVVFPQGFGVADYVGNYRPEGF